MIKSLVLVGLSLFAFQAEPSKEVRARLFKQILADDSELRECLTQPQGGQAEAEQEMMVERVDLNRDGIKEYKIQLCACSLHNCGIYVYRRVGDGFESILDDAAGLGTQFLRTSSNGYRDLQINARDGAAAEVRTVYKFDGRQYREAQARIVDRETGESKPAFRRVQFKRGSSSTTVHGKVSIVLPDTYLLGARAGQIMSVQLTSAQESVRFLLLSPKSTIADKARSWTGTLPETGDYEIIVDGDKRGGAYSITISIK